MNTYKYLLSFVVLFSFSTPLALAQEQVLTLEQAKALAKSNNKNTKIAAQNVAAAKAAKVAAYASDKPFIEASAMGIHVGEPISALIPENQATASLGVTQVIYAGRKIKTGKQISNKAVDLYSLQKVLTESEVLLDVETTYWQMVNINSKIELAHQYKELLAALLKDLTNSFKAGLIYKNDVLRVQVQLNQAELDLRKATDQLSILKLKMAQLTGLSIANFKLANNTFTQLKMAQEIESLTAVNNRPEIKMLQSAVEIEELQTKVLEGDRKPTVSLNVSGLYATGKGINFANNNNSLNTYYGVLNVSIPVFDWGSRKQKVKEQEFKTQAKQLELEDTQELIIIEIEQAYLQLQQAIQKIEITEKSLQQADENLRLHQDRFHAGTVIGKDVLEAQVLWQQAYTDVIDAKAMYQINLANYKKVTGKLN